MSRRGGWWHGRRARAISAAGVHADRRRAGFFHHLLPLALVATPWGCADSPLEHAARSPESLVSSALAAVAAEDRGELERLLVTEGEYESLLWPEMPDKDYTRFDFVWSLVSANSRKGMRQVLSSYGGLKLELVSIEFEEEPEVYESFVLRPGARVVVRRADTGEEGVLATFDVFIEYGDAWKLLNYDEL